MPRARGAKKRKADSTAALGVWKRAQEPILRNCSLLAKDKRALGFPPCLH